MKQFWEQVFDEREATWKARMEDVDRRWTERFAERESRWEQRLSASHRRENILNAMVLVGSILWLATSVAYAVK